MPQAGDQVKNGFGPATTSIVTVSPGQGSKLGAAASEQLNVAISVDRDASKNRRINALQREETRRAA